ncbi:glycoside hydrolase family 13 protein [Hamadaea tsunoensis]|uniref:glycoside hydrolase family 13 protein n=1 Tax=Hamadaea tsunoensis TaxID=53368 RepID=UPI000420E4CA|nr:alpha-amylase family glycosyl hydrolase [Hamadaea tsunoensis]
MTEDWWRHAAIYQIYPRSFADGDGDGVGDITGIRARLPYLRELGIDAVWLSPWYTSPQADAGYDVADYRDIDPLFGTLADAEAFIHEAHDHAIRVIVDIVPNHCSDRHPWFQAALAAGPGSPERELFWFRPGRGEHGELPPNDWQSNFGGPAWTRVPDGQWYLHMFAPEQPDWNWDNPRVREDFERTLRFWLDRGVDGFRIDVADNLVKDPNLPDVATLPDGAVMPWGDQEGVHEIYREWRKIADSYPQRAIFVGEVWLPDPVRFTRFLRPDELHTGFNFAFLSAPWEPAELRRTIDATLSTHALVHAPATWVLSNHDVPRVVTRYGRAQTAHTWESSKTAHVADLALGTRRARAAALLTTSLPGSVYVYQGEELGLPEVQDIPEELLADPRWIRSGHTDRGRDGCRVPLPWSGDAPPFGFGPAGSTPWLPQPPGWAALTAEAEADDPGSTLSLYRSALRIRHAEPDLLGEDMEWLPSSGNVLAYRRGRIGCMINFADPPVPLPVGAQVLLTSEPVDGDLLPTDVAAWFRLP